MKETPPMKMLSVIPVDGRKLPREGAPRRYVDGPMDVPDVAYYRRALARGDIALAPAAKASKKAPSSAVKEG